MGRVDQPLHLRLRFGKLPDPDSDWRTSMALARSSGELVFGFIVTLIQKSGKGLRGRTNAIRVITQRRWLSREDFGGELRRE